MSIDCELLYEVESCAEAVDFSDYSNYQSENLGCSYSCSGTCQDSCNATCTANCESGSGHSGW